jgi:sterol desaturase/sphingolipid hydroxylase (fatty acid hydroxylase superfamily)
VATDVARGVTSAPVLALRSVAVEPARTRSPSRWPTVGVALLVAGGLVVGFRPAWGLVVGAAVAIPLERRYRRHEQPVRRPGIRTDVVHFLFTHLLESACLLAAAALCWIPLHHLTLDATQRWLADRHPVVVALLGLLLFDLLYYAEHRLAHRWAFLWRFHAVHHSSEHLDWLAAARLHPFEAFIAGFLVAPPFILLGFDVAQLGLLSVVTGTWAVLIHANVNWRLRWLDRIYPTPEYHHWHHANEPGARDKNFGLPLYDLLFGTYHLPRDRRPTTYGIDEPMPDGWSAQLAHPFRRAGSTAGSAPSRAG